MKDRSFAYNARGISVPCLACFFWLSTWLTAPAQEISPPPAAPPAMTVEEFNALADLQVLAERSPEMLAQRRNDLPAAADKGWLRVVKFLVEHKVPDLDFASALFNAAAAGQVQTVDYLLTHGADAKNDGGAALVPALGNNRMAVVYKLIDAGADLNAGAVENGPNQYFSPAKARPGDPLPLTRPLAMALNSRNRHLVRYLVEKGARCDAPVEAGGFKGEFPLHQAWNAELVRFLVEHGADREARNAQGLTPLLAQTLAGNFEVAEALIAAGADLKATAGDGTEGTVIDQLTFSLGQHPAFIELPKDRSQPPGWRFREAPPVQDENDPRIPVMRQQAVRILDATVKAGVSVDGPARKEGDKAKPAGRTALAQGCESLTTPAQAAFLAELIRHGANVNAADENGITPLHFAALQRSRSVIELLLKNGADPLAETTAPLEAANANSGKLLQPRGAARQPGRRPAIIPGPRRGQTPVPVSNNFFRYRPLHLTAVNANGSPDSAGVLLLARATYAKDFPERNSGIWHDYSPLRAPVDNPENGYVGPGLNRISDPALDGEAPVTLLEAVLRADLRYARISPEVHIFRKRPGDDREAEDIVFDLNTLTAANPPALPELQAGDVLLLLSRPEAPRLPSGQSPEENNEALPRNLAVWLEEKQALQVTLAAPDSASELNSQWRVIKPLLKAGTESYMDLARRTFWTGREVDSLNFALSRQGTAPQVRRIVRADGKTVVETPERPRDFIGERPAIFLREGDTIEITAPEAGTAAQPAGIGGQPRFLNSRPFDVPVPQIIPNQHPRQRTILPSQ